MKNKFILLVCLLFVSTLFGDYLEYRIRVMGITNSLIKVHHIKSDDGGLFDVHVETLAAVSIFSNVNNYYYSTYTNGFTTNFYRKNIEQSNYSEQREVTLNYETGIAHMKDILKNEESEFPIFSETSDLFCGLFRMCQNATVGGSFHIFSNRHLWRVEYKPAGTETINTSIGKKSAYKISVYFHQVTEGDFKCTDIFTNNILKENQLLELWISDDDDRIPVQAILHRKSFKVYWDILEYIHGDSKE
ncbi:MAG: DUF3108 domain-containing protein [Candidatus Cloacimonetes bacterium]|nr:DUF3108 domain-containing protein [Candidatus Cloacimonadota bacterium]